MNGPEKLQVPLGIISTDKNVTISFYFSSIVSQTRTFYWNRFHVMKDKKLC